MLLGVVESIFIFSSSFLAFKTKSITTKESTKGDHFNSSKLSNEEAYNKLSEFIKSIENSSDIFDIKLSDYLKLSNTVKVIV